MSNQVDDYYPTLKAAIAEAKAAGLNSLASKLEADAFAMYSSSSELLGEQGKAILAFLKLAGPKVPPSVSGKLEQCLIQIRKVWPQL